MSRDVFKANEEFLESKGLILEPRGDTFWVASNDDFYVSINEWSNITITNKKTNKSHWICMSTNLLDESDFKKE